eukprot:gene2239-2551_t
MKKGPQHPKFADMICKAMLEEQNGNDYHGSTLQSLKKSIGHGGYELSGNWEKHLAHAIKMMMAKKQLVHASAAHSGHMKLSKSMLEKLARKRSPKKAGKDMPMDKAEGEAPQQEEAPAADDAKEKKKKAPVRKAKSPAKRAKKAHAKAGR